MDTEKQIQYRAYLKAKGFTLFDEAVPQIGKLVEAVRVHQPRGVDGVNLSTERLVVPVIRESEFNYTDTLHQDRCLASSEFDAWRELDADKHATSENVDK